MRFGSSKLGIYSKSLQFSNARNKERVVKTLCDQGQPKYPLINLHESVRMRPSHMFKAFVGMGDPRGKQPKSITDIDFNAEMNYWDKVC
jgi:hypothetical protein